MEHKGVQLAFCDIRTPLSLSRKHISLVNLLYHGWNREYKAAHIFTM